MRPQILGTGSFTPDTRVTNNEYMDALRPVNPRTGERVPADWLEKHFEIVTRAYDARFPEVYKPSRAEGGLYDGDFAVKAAKKALIDAGLRAAEIDVLVHVSCTPDTCYCADHFRFITAGLGLRSDVYLVHHNLGCAGVASGLRSVAANLFANGDNTTVLLVASNCPSGYLSPETLANYRAHPDPWAWLSPAVFGDGAGAMIFRLNGDANRGLIHTWYETHPEIPLVEYPGGGCVMHTRQENVGQHLFLMHPETVNAVFVQLMMKNLERIQADWPTKMAPHLGFAFDPTHVKRWYLHQANGPAVRQAAQAMGLPETRVPINITELGNTSAASTLLLFDADRKANVVQAGDLVIFMWIGAGNGAMNGYAIIVL